MKKIFTLAALCFLAQNSSAQCPIQFLQNGPIDVCQNSTMQLSVTPGADNYDWIVNGALVLSGTADNYTLPTSLPNTFTLQVNATFGSCTSSTAPLIVTVNPQPGVPIVISPLSACQWSTPFPLTATGVNLLWYATQVGGIGVPTGPVINTSIPGTITYWVSQTVNGCESERIDQIVSILLTCDSVWPGDVNYDLIADNNDILDLGLYNGETGPARSSVSINWSEQIGTNWQTTQLNGEDMKHADCDGDGTVDAMVDVNAVNQNYGLIHQKGVHIPQAKSASLPDLYFDLTGITFTAGTTVSVPIKLGTSSLPMNNILGIAAKVKVQNVTLDNAPTVSNTTSWLASGSNALNFYKGVTNNQTDWALVRTDHNNASGDGTIAILTMDIPAGSSGDAILYFEDVKIINNAGQEITDYNVVDDTASIVPVTIGNTIKEGIKITVVPNPSEAQAALQLTVSEITDLQINITDIMGKQVWSNNVTATKGNNTIALPTHLASGMYIIRINGAGTGTVKWIKK